MMPEAHLEEAENVPETQSQLISQAVVELAGELGWDYQLWYHDAPVWLLSKEDAGERMTRMVQLAIWREGSRRFLDIVPNVYQLSVKAAHVKRSMRVADRKKAMVTMRVPDDLIEWLPEPIQRLDRAFRDVPGKLRARVKEVMQAAEAVTADELTSAEDGHGHPTAQHG